MTKTTSDTPMVYDVDEHGAIRHRPMNADELAQAKIDAKDAIDETRKSKQRAIEQALAATDWYALRQAEGGAKMPAKVSAYRAALRELHGTLDSAKDPTKIELPDPPKEGTR